MRAAGAVITTGCGDAGPMVPGKRYEDWVVDDSAGKDVAAVRPVRNAICVRVEHFLRSLEGEARVSSH